MAVSDVVGANALARTPKTGEMIADRLRRQIARGDLAIGERLPTEDELTATFGIARTTLREALRILESQGLLEIRRGRAGGPVVTMPQIGSLAEGLAVTSSCRALPLVTWTPPASCSSRVWSGGSRRRTLMMISSCCAPLLIVPPPRQLY